MSKLRKTTLALAYLAIALSCIASGQRPSSRASALERELKQVVPILWSNMPLRDAMQSLRETRKLPIWLDRRCDPSLPVTLQSRASLATSLQELANQHSSLDVAWSNDIIYVGPAGMANRWATTTQQHRQQIGKLPVGLRSRWLRKRPWSWSRLAEPQALLANLEREIGSPVRTRERITHDLWPGAEFRPLPLYVRLELLVAGFGYSFAWNSDGAVELTPMPEHPHYTASVKLSKAEQRELLPAFLKQHPGATWSDARLTGDWKAHYSIGRLLAAEASDPDLPNYDTLRISLRAQDQPLESLLRQLAGQLSLQIEFSESARSKAEAMVSFEVQQATVDELLQAALGPAKLRHERQDNIVRIQEKSVEPTP